MGWDSVATMYEAGKTMHEVPLPLARDPYGCPDRALIRQRQVPNKQPVDTMESVAPPKENKANDQKKV